VPNHARKQLPAPLDPEHLLDVDLVDVTAAGFTPSGAEGRHSPARQLQWELYQRYSAERRPVSMPYPAPVRLGLLLAAGAGSWAAFYGVARIALQAIH